MAHIQTQTEWEEEMSVKILTFISHELYLDLRYLKPALSAFSYHRVDGLLTFATDGRVFCFSAEPLLRIFQENDRFLGRAYLHVALHCVFRHLWLMGRREKKLWGLACDIAVEYTIDCLGKASTKRILSWIRKDTYAILNQEKKAVSAAVVYRWLKMQDAEKRKELAKEFYTDDHRFWPEEKDMDAPLVRRAQQDWERTARQVTMELNRRGDDPKEGEARFLAQAAAAKGRRNYGDFLRKFAVLQEEACLDPDEFDLCFYTYGLKIYKNMPLIEPLETREAHKIREFVIVIDTSESTSGDLVQGFLRETCAILSAKNSFFETCSVRILQCDDAVRRDETVCCQREFERLIGELSIAGGGGTDFRPAFSYVDQLRGRGELQRLGGLLYFTDGRGSYPAKMPDYKTAFLFLEDYDETAVPPWAMRLQLEPEEFLHEH